MFALIITTALITHDHIPPQAPELPVGLILSHSTNAGASERMPSKGLLSRVGGSIPPQAPTMLPAIKVGNLPATYAEALERSRATGKPLVVWLGKAICVPCIKANSDEFVMFHRPSLKGFPDHTLSVAVPINGEMKLVGQVHSWEDGHMPTIRRIKDTWERTRSFVSSVDPPGTSPTWMRE